VEFPGGKAGCDRYLVHGLTLPAVGARVVVFMDAARDYQGKAKPDFRVIQAWPVDATGSVDTPTGEKVTTEELANSAAP
jgi:hypothetical protein